MPSLMRGWVCNLELLLGLTSTACLGSESHGTHYHILLSQFPDYSSLEGQELVCQITPRAYNFSARTLQEIPFSLFVPSSPIVGTLMMEELDCSETSVPRAAQRNIPEDGILNKGSFTMPLISNICLFNGRCFALDLYVIVLKSIPLMFQSIWRHGTEEIDFKTIFWV
jgi:hypothetical protein